MTQRHCVAQKIMRPQSCKCPAKPPVFVRYPIEDLRPAPSMEFLSDCIDDLAERVRSGEVLYIHCFAGRGRTGLIACCLLGALYEGMDAEEALGRVGPITRRG